MTEINPFDPPGEYVAGRVRMAVRDHLDQIAVVEAPAEVALRASS